MVSVRVGFFQPEIYNHVQKRKGSFRNCSGEYKVLQKSKCGPCESQHPNGEEEGAFNIIDATLSY